MSLLASFRAPAVLLLSAGLLVPAAGAADLGGYNGSVKDDYAPVAVAAPVGNCYFRADVGYSGSADPKVTWPVTDATTGDFITDHVKNLNTDGSWFGEAGVGCGSGSSGFRGDVTFGYHGQRSYDGEPGPWNPSGPPPANDPLHTSVTSYTMMINGYKDLGNYRGFVPYLGVGVGFAYNTMDDVSFTQNPALVNEIRGGSDLSLAWALMAGVAYQISPRAILDVGYRYIDLGTVSSERNDTAGNVNPRVTMDDIAAHEVKVGLRYHFGSSDCCAYQAMK